MENVECLLTLGLMGLAILVLMWVLHYMCITMKKKMENEKQTIKVLFLEKSGRPIGIREIETNELPGLVPDYEIYGIGDRIYAKEKHESTRREKIPINLDEINQTARERYRPAF